MNKPQYKYTSPRGLGSGLSILLIFNILLLILSIGFKLLEIDLARRFLGGEDFTQSEIDSSEARIANLGGFFNVFKFVLAVIFLKWIYRVSANAHFYSATDMTYSAGWSVGWFFVPIMNLFRPYRAMKETWQVSVAGPDVNSPFDVEVPSILPMWWALWIIYSISSRISLRVAMVADSTEDLLTADYVSLVDYTLGICLSLVAVMMVRELTKIQTERGADIDGSPVEQVCPECGEQIHSVFDSCPMCGATLDSRGPSTEVDSNPFADPNPPADSNPFAT